MNIRRLLGLADSRTAVDEEVERLVQRGDYASAGRLLQENGLLSRAADVFLAGGEYRAAADVLTRLGRRDEALDAARRGGGRGAETPARGVAAAQAADAFLQRGNSLDAARVFAQAGQWARAAELYARAGFPLRAAEAWERAGDARRAAEAYERHVADNPPAPGAPATSPERRAALKAGQLYARSGLPDKGLQLLVRGGHFAEAGDLALAVSRFADAAGYYVRADDLEQAATAWERAGDPVRAALARGEVCLHSDRTAEAAAYFVEGHDFYRAAELYESLGRVADAAAAYEAGGAFNEAGQAFLQAGDKARAAAAFEHGGQFERAAELREELGDWAQAATLYEQADRPFQAGRAAAQAGDVKHAVALLQRVEPDDEGHAEATEQLVQLFLSSGLPRLALERLQLVLGDGKPAPANLGLHYWLAVSHETLGERAVALDLYRRILAVDFAHRDVAERVQRLTAAVGAPPAPPPAAVAPPAAASAPPAALAPPAVVPPSPVAAAPAGARFALREQIGRGPLGSVHRAEDRDGRSVAVRLFGSTAVGEPLLRGLLGDLTPAARLSHPNLVKVIAVEELDGQPCVVTELVRGTNMADLLRSGQRLSLKRCHALGRALALALSFVHGKGLAHGSVRPSNVFVAGGIVKLADLGLGSLYRVAVPADCYRAPENRLDVAGDVFALGATLYHLLTGCEPPRTGALPVLPPKPSDLVAGVPVSVDRLLLRALDPQPAARFTSAKEVVHALDAMVTIG